jgi:hypothetical protein
VLVTALANLGSMVGTFIGIPIIFDITGINPITEIGSVVSNLWSMLLTSLGLG